MPELVRESALDQALAQVKELAPERGSEPGLVQAQELVWGLEPG